MAEDTLMKTHAAAPHVARNFSQHLNINDHGRGHSDENPFSCSTRDKKFSDYLNMNEHGRGHSDETHSAAPQVIRHLPKI